MSFSERTCLRLSGSVQLRQERKDRSILLVGFVGCTHGAFYSGFRSPLSKDKNEQITASDQLSIKVYIYMTDLFLVA